MTQRVQKRAAIMVVCEGKTEENLWRWLNVAMRDCPLAIHYIKCRGGGDAHDILTWAVKQYERAKQSRDLDRLVVMLDTDNGWDQPINGKDAQGFAQKKNMIPILSRPRCEHLLMRLKGQPHKIASCFDAKVEKRLVAAAYGAEPHEIDWAKQGFALRHILSQQEFHPLMEAFPFLWDSL